MVQIVVPELGHDYIRLSAWLVEVGEAVQAGERIAELRIPGAAIGVLAPIDGRLSSRLASVNQELRPGQVIGELAPE